jgi:hypothetical protein
MRMSQVKPQARPVRPLDRAFFNRDPRPVSRALLGKVLVREVFPGLSGGSSKSGLTSGEEDPPRTPPLVKPPATPFCLARPAMRTSTSFMETTTA